jgi:DNA-binding response OmpR family regulator
LVLASRGCAPQEVAKGKQEENMRHGIPIMVVEDNADMADLYQAYLEPKYQVTLASSAAHARRILTTHQPYVMVLDLMLADSSGDRFLRELLDTPRLAAMKVVLVSGRNDVATIAADHGLHGWLRKPFNMDELLVLLEKAAV